MSISVAHLGTVATVLFKIFNHLDVPCSQIYFKGELHFFGCSFALPVLTRKQNHLSETISGSTVAEYRGFWSQHNLWSARQLKK